MSQGNQLCAEGCSRLATMYCQCTGQKTYLCDACLPNHRQKNPFVAHNTIDAKIDSTSEVYQQRFGLFLERKRILEGYLTKMEECSLEFERRMNEIIGKIERYKETQLGQLNQSKHYARSVLELGVREVEATLMQDYPALQGEYSPFLRGIQDQSPLFFDFVLVTDAVESNIEIILTCYWQEPQEFHPEPSEYLQMQAGQNREIYMPQDYYGEAQVSQCMVCRMPFNGQGKYCSPQCAQRTGAQAPQPQPIQKRQKKCCFCSRPVLSPLIVPPHLSMYQSFAKEVCSLKCLEQYQRLAADDTTCLGCKLPITDPKAPELPCHHKFHNTGCLFQLLDTISNKFSIELTFIDCPKCGGRCGLKDVIKYFPGSEYSDRKRWSLESSCTVCRNPAAVRMPGCGHMLCIDHSQGGVYCAYCRRSFPAISLPSRPISKKR